MRCALQGCREECRRRLEVMSEFDEFFAGDSPEKVVQPSFWGVGLADGPAFAVASQQNLTTQR